MEKRQKHVKKHSCHKTVGKKARDKKQIAKSTS